MKLDKKKIVPLKRENISIPLEELSEEDKLSIHYSDLADSLL